MEGNHKDSNVIDRYSRQMVMSGFGMEHQRCLLDSTVLVIGCGGIGSTVIMYLAGAGVNMTLCDFDDVEESNLHRQIIHDTQSLGQNKAISAMTRIKALNPSIVVNTVTEKITAANLQDLVQGVDIVVDATDNYESRFLINDACVLGKKPLVSGSAVGMEGQITVFMPSSGPCYRCLYPDPAALQSCQSCSDAGVLGPVPGIIGSLQAVEVIKLLRIQKSVATTPSANPLEILNGKQLMYNACTSEFHSFVLPEKNPSCQVCSLDESRRIKSLSDSCEELSVINNDVNSPHVESKEESSELSISVKSYYDEVLVKGKPHILLDVRSEEQFSIISLMEWQESGAMCLVNSPLKKLKGGKITKLKNKLAEEEKEKITALRTELEHKTPEEAIKIYVLCRRGIDSMLATSYLVKDCGLQNVYNLEGGLQKWKKDVNETFPSY